VILAPDEQGAVVTAEKRPAALLVKMPNDIDVLVASGENYCMKTAYRIPDAPDGRSESAMGVQAMAADGLLTIRSSYGPEETMIRFEAEVKEKGMTVFARVDHAAGAAAVGLSLRHATYAIKSGYWNRSADKGTGLAGCIGRHMAFVQ